MESLRKEIETHARGVNRMLTPEYLKKLSYVELLRSVHPLDRLRLAKQLSHENLISKMGMKLFQPE